MTEPASSASFDDIAGVVAPGPWNGDGRMVPMNQYYDPKLFDILPEEDVRWSERWKERPHAATYHPSQDMVEGPRCQSSGWVAGSGFLSSSRF